ncbi:MAG: ATP-binding protein [Helicobacteraceae bacterium]|jgi:SpoVK/Ycf46/Vps4 family AAA+-type ATPase|nr:ATP-binding protein [Helicobacteraceae bacterium]
MKLLILNDFLGCESIGKSAIFPQLKCSEESALILRELTKIYLQGTAEISIFALLTEVCKFDRLDYLNHIGEIRELLELGWIVMPSLHKSRAGDLVSLELLHENISLSVTFMKLLEEGSLEVELPEAKPYGDQLEYLQDEFARIGLYQKLALIRQNYDNTSPNFIRVKNRIALIENQIKTRVNISKNPPKLIKYFKDRHLNEKERVIFLALLKEEYGGADENLRDMNTLIELISFNDFEKIKNRSLLEENSPLISKGIVDYDEVLTPFGGISRSFFIAEGVLSDIMRPKKKVKQKIKIETLIKEQEIFELVDPKTTLEDVVLHPETRELLDNLIRQMDHKVLKRLKDWGIKDKTRGIDAKIIFHGAPGTGKTMTAYSVAKTLKKQVISFDCSKILSMYVGESEKNTRKIFDTYKEIVQKTNTQPILLLNEADQFLSGRVTSGVSGAEKMHNQMQNIFLEQIEKFEGVLIATTNLLDNIDSAFSRRFDYKIKFEKPNEAQRLLIWQKHLPKTAPFSEDFNVNNLVKHPLTGAQIALAVRSAAMIVAANEKGVFNMEVFEKAIKNELSGAFDYEKTLGFLS